MKSANELFSSRIEYKGLGTATFSHKFDTADGNVTGYFDEFGKHEVEMETQSDSMLFRAIPCSRLEIHHENGTFEAKDQATEVHENLRNIHYFPHSASGMNTLKFHHISKSRFDVTGAQPPRYWVLPLSNFFSGFGRITSEINDHPLCIEPDSPKVLFDFNGEKGFIQKLPDYDDRQKAVKEGNQKMAVSALMVGSIEGISIEYAELENRFPFEFLALLGLATGSEVGSPWIDFYDENGNFVSRIHANFGLTPYIKGHAAIDEDINRSTGQLLTSYAQYRISSEFDSNLPLLTVLRCIIRSGRFEQYSLEERFSSVCRALELLTKFYNVNTQNLSTLLPHTQQQAVKNALSFAKDYIKDELKRLSHSTQRTALSRIVGRVDSADKAEKMFGLAVCDLLIRFDLKDNKALEVTFKEDWDGLLSQLRGAIFHEGYFNLQIENNSGSYNPHLVIAVWQHLHDILVRIVFSIIGYNGTYQPFLSNQPRSSINKDWVTETTPACELGYPD